MLQNYHHDLEDLARQLEASADYRVLRRLAPREPTAVPAGSNVKIGIILDVETTGLDSTRDEVIELGMVKFRYSTEDEITGVSAAFQSFHQPSIPIPTEITELTGITDEMVAGQAIDTVAVESFVADANVVIAHNSNFDRKFAERFWPVFAHKPWACSATEIDWKSFGFSGAKLSYLLAEAGLFHGAHRAIDDCHAVLELLAGPLPGISTSGLSCLLAQARRTTYRIWAENSPFHLKHVLKGRGYRWSNGADGTLRAWYIDVVEDKRDIELEFLHREIYQRDIDIEWRKITALDRFSNRA